MNRGLAYDLLETRSKDIGEIEAAYQRREENLRVQFCSGKISEDEFRAAIQAIDVAREFLISHGKISGQAQTQKAPSAPVRNERYGLIVAVLAFAAVAFAVAVYLSSSAANSSGDAPSPRPTPIPTPEMPPTPSPTPSPRPTPLPTPEMPPTPSPTPSPRPTPIPTPEMSPTPSPTPIPQPTPIPTPEMSPTPSPTPIPKAIPLIWPDGRIITHPEACWKTWVVNVASGDTLKLRWGPGTRFKAIAEIPADAADLLAFDKDAAWDGDTWWYPIAWHDFRGYVGGRYLPHDQ